MDYTNYCLCDVYSAISPFVNTRLGLSCTAQIWSLCVHGIFIKRRSLSRERFSHVDRVQKVDRHASAVEHNEADVTHFVDVTSLRTYSSKSSLCNTSSGNKMIRAIIQSCRSVTLTLRFIVRTAMFTWLWQLSRSQLSLHQHCCASPSRSSLVSAL